MNELTFTLLRVGYLVLLWLFVLIAISVLRRDVTIRAAISAGIPARGRKAAKAAKAAAGPATGQIPATAQRPVNAPSTPVVPPPGTPAPIAAGQPRRAVVMSGPQAGARTPLDQSAITLGRGPVNTVVLEDEYASTRHARIFPHAGQWFIEDLGSTNGTFMGDTPVTGPVPLPIGTAVRVGHTMIELQG